MNAMTSAEKCVPDGTTEMMIRQSSERSPSGKTSDERLVLVDEHPPRPIYLITARSFEFTLQERIRRLTRQ